MPNVTPIQSKEVSRGGTSKKVEVEYAIVVKQPLFVMNVFFFCLESPDMENFLKISIQN